VRASGPEPVVRILIEADDPALCKTHAAVIIAALKECF
jgi:phosphomannomutase